jgi:tetratricopeptide (TPR) repeat protein
MSFLAASNVINAQEPPEWFFPLRDAVYGQTCAIDKILSLYQEARQNIKQLPSGDMFFTMLSRCECMMGRAYMLEGQKSEAANYFEGGVTYAEQSIVEKPTEAGYQMLAENISQLCTAKSIFWVMANDSKAEQYAKEALRLNPYNVSAQLTLAVRYVLTPPPFSDYSKGLQILQKIPLENIEGMQRDDLFNVYWFTGFVYNKQKNYEESRIRFEKALTIYPTNKYVRELLLSIQ